MRLNWKLFSLLSASLLGSFFITLWLTGPPDLPPVYQPEELKTIAGTSNIDLLEKLSASGLRADSSITGHVDVYEREPDKSIRIAGWALDRGGDGSPLTVSVYVDGKPRLTVNTAGPRDDVTRTFNLPKYMAKNIAFSGTFNCETSAPGMVLVVDPVDGRYSKLDPQRCP